jgi:subtilisin family serine protease
VSSQSIPAISKPAKSKPAKTTRTNKKRLNLAEKIPWGINAVQANGVQPGSDAGDIAVCVVDTGYDMTHTDLPGRNSVNGTDSDKDSGDFDGYEWDVDEDWDGTHVSSFVFECHVSGSTGRCGSKLLTILQASLLFQLQ